MDPVDVITNQLAKVSIKKKNKKKQKHSGSTPYQGKRRCFGEYECPNCSNTWSSGNSWANKGQQCINCLNNVFPHRQTPLQRSRKSKDKPHLSNLCEMCKEIGYNCVTFNSHR